MKDILYKPAPITCHHCDRGLFWGVHIEGINACSEECRKALGITDADLEECDHDDSEIYYTDYIAMYDELEDWSRPPITEEHYNYLIKIGYINKDYAFKYDENNIPDDRAFTYTVNGITENTWEVPEMKENNPY